ncbi:hypothetical protein D9757_003183 [Collybiopsis confluens]|uniref:NodB homology domain-containing protein n=1 Tax=Collybiopsis confluens TaxID=2823264 RepID=A0A8H5MF00_9AGAR|nr:hypothetical protein D9757_003183 [Collybiopsis confluens]
MIQSFKDLGEKFAKDGYKGTEADLPTAANSSCTRSMPAKRVLISFGVDVDAVAGWLGSYGGEDSPSDIARGMFAGEVGVPRLLKLFKKYDMKTTWFIPGHSLETFLEQMTAVRDAGHEMQVGQGLHGYSHENPISMTVEQQRDVLDHTFKLLTDFNHGKPPKGSVAPWWESSKEGIDLLLDKGVQYGTVKLSSDTDIESDPF